MEKKKIQLTEEDLKLGPTELQKKYDLSSRGHAWYILKKGYYWENYLSVSESFSHSWVEENLKEIERAVKLAVWFKARQKGVINHHLFWELKEDLFQEGLLYVITRAGEIQTGKSKLINIAETGIDHAICKYFKFGDGKNTVRKFDFLDDASIYSSTESSTENDEDSIDEIFLQIKEEIISSFGEKYWDEIWSWATGKSRKLPEEIIIGLKMLAL